MHKQITKDYKKLALNYTDKLCPKIMTFTLSCRLDIDWRLHPTILKSLSV